MNTSNVKKALGGLLVAIPMAVFAFTDVSASSLVNAAFAGYGHDKVKICHNKQTIEVAAPAVAAHLKHGDTLGKCKPEREDRDHHEDDDRDDEYDHNNGHESDDHDDDRDDDHDKHDD